MRRIFLSLWMLLALAVGVAAQGCGDQNPNCIVPTAPPGTSNNQAASTAFVQQNILNVSAVALGADPTEVSDSTSAINNCLSFKTTGNLICWLAPGNYAVSGQLNIGNGNGTTSFSTINGVKLACTVPTRPGLNGISGEPSAGPCNINSSFAGVTISVNGPINGWSIEGISLTLSSSNSAAGCLVVSSGSFGRVESFLCNDVPGIGILEFVNSGGGQPSYFNAWRNIQIRALPASTTFQGIHIGSNQASTDNFGDSWENTNIIPSTSSASQAIYLGSADSMVFNRTTINPGTGSALTFNYAEAGGSNNNWPSGITFINFDAGSGNSIGNSGTPSASAKPNVLMLNTVNNGTIPNLSNLTVLGPNDIIMSSGANRVNGHIFADNAGHFGVRQSGPTITSGCNGTGSVVNGNDNDGQVAGQTANATTCVVTFANAYTSPQACIAAGASPPLTSFTYTQSTMTVTFPSTAAYFWSYHCAALAP